MFTKSSVPSVLLMLFVAMPGQVRARSPFLGFVASLDCTAVDGASAEGELIASLGTFGGSTDAPRFLFDLTSKGGTAIEATRLLGANYESLGDWGSYPWDTVFVRIVLPPLSPGGPARVALDAKSHPHVDMGLVIPLGIGNSLPVGADAGIGLVISPAGQYPVNFGSVTHLYPQRDADGSTTLAFAPLAEIDRGDDVDECTVTQHVFGTGTLDMGGIRGYNVFRIPAPSAGDPDAFTTALTDGDPTTGFMTFIDLARFRLGVATDVTVDPATNDLDASDGAFLHDPDGRMYSGDEVILWTDVATGPLAHPIRAPLQEQAYLYAIQPVAHGTVAAAHDCYTNNCVLQGEHRRDLDGNGSYDSVDLDGLDPADLSVEFISPQFDPAEGGQAGLGLTFRSKLALSTAISVEPVPLRLRRSTELIRLDPVTPDLDVFLPLASDDDYIVPFASGDVDPDPSVLQPGTFPLVYYQVPRREIRLSVTDVAGRNHVRITF